MTGLADDADAAYWNPGGLGFQEHIGFAGTYCEWLPGLYPGMGYYYCSAGFGRSNPISKKILNIGLNYTYLSTGKYDVIDEEGNYLGEATSYDEAFGVHFGIGLTNKIGLGLGIKYIYSAELPSFWFEQPYVGKGSSFAADFGVLYKPKHFLSLGFTLANIGPRFTYTESGASDPLPRMLRIGLCYTPIDNEVLRLRIFSELNKVLVGMFHNPYYDTLNLGQELAYEWREAWKSLGIEATIYNIFTWRFGYFEDVTGGRGGIRVKKDYYDEYLSLLEYIFSRNREHIDKIGITYGFSINYKDYLSFDISDDHLIYDFNTSNVKFSLTSHDLIGLARKIAQYF